MSDDVGFVCPHCTTKIKYTAGMTFGEVMSLRHDKERLTLQVTCFRDELAAVRNELAAVTAERDRMREALRPFKQKSFDCGGRHILSREYVLVKWLLDARAALESVTDKKGAGNE